MPVQKKKKNQNKEKRAINPNVFTWTGQRKKAALMIAEGTTNYKDIASEVGVHYVTFWEWRQHPIFQAEVSRLILTNEKATREGLLRIAYKAIDEKIGNISDDRSTVLEWSKFIADLQGFMKQKVELEDISKREQPPLTPEVIEAQHTLLKAVANAKHKTDN